VGFIGENLYLSFRNGKLSTQFFFKKYLIERTNNILFKIEQLIHLIEKEKNYYLKKMYMIKKLMFNK
jgi:hypothetical protein